MSISDRIKQLKYYKGHLGQYPDGRAWIDNEIRELKQQQRKLRIAQLVSMFGKKNAKQDIRR